MLHLYDSGFRLAEAREVPSGPRMAA